MKWINLGTRDELLEVVATRYRAATRVEFKTFTEQMDAPPADNPRLRRLLAEKAPWER